MPKIVPKKERSRRSKKFKTTPSQPIIRPNAGGIDVGATELYVAVPLDADAEPVRTFGTFTEDLHALADWLTHCHIETVALESTGVYWIPIFQILEARGIEVCLVNARHVKNVPGRKTDVSDWLARSRSSRPSACLRQPTPRLPKPPVLPMAAVPPLRWLASRLLPPTGPSLCRTQSLASSGCTHSLRRQSRSAYAKGAHPNEHPAR